VRHCPVARPGNYRYRSCSLTFEQLGNYRGQWSFSNSTLALNGEGNLVRLFILTGNRRKLGSNRRNRRSTRQQDDESLSRLRIARRGGEPCESGGTGGLANPTPKTGSGWQIRLPSAGKKRSPCNSSRVRSRALLRLYRLANGSHLCASANHSRVRRVAHRRQTVPRQFHRREIASPALKLTAAH